MMTVVTESAPPLSSDDNLGDLAPDSQPMKNRRSSPASAVYPFHWRSTELRSLAPATIENRASTDQKLKEHSIMQKLIMCEHPIFVKTSGQTLDQASVYQLPSF
jgi:hypothetical protein